MSSDSIKTFRALNCTFAIVGQRLTVLELASEVDEYTWLRKDISGILRLCPRMTSLRLLSVFAWEEHVWPIEGEWPAGDEAPIALNSLTHLHLRASRWDIEGLHGVLAAPSLLNAHVDIVSRCMGDDSRFAVVWGGMPGLERDVEAAAACFQPKGLLANRLSVAMHVQSDIDEEAAGTPLEENWPEFLQMQIV